MTEEQIFETLKEIVIDIKEEEMELDRATALVENDILDSLEIINYLTQIEEKFEKNITFDELVDKKLGIFDNMIKYLKG